VTVAEPLLSVASDPPEPAKLSPAEMAREVNAVIYEMAESLDRLVPDDQGVGFLCECGCLGIAAIALGEYRAAGGAWIAGHQAQ
jgi:hypothetical protein